MVEIACLSRLINANAGINHRNSIASSVCSTFSAPESVNLTALDSKLTKICFATLIRNTGSYIRREHEGQLQTPLLRPLSKQGDTPDKLSTSAVSRINSSYRLQF